MQIKHYRDLIVWQKSMEIVVLVYTLTNQFPKNEVYGLSSQMRRAAVSIPSNIAEGFRRGTRKDYRSFLMISFGSGAELETQIEVALRVSYCTKEDVRQLCATLDEVMRMLHTLTNKLATAPASSPTTYNLQPTTSSKSPTTYNLQPTT